MYDNITIVSINDIEDRDKIYGVEIFNKNNQYGVIVDTIKEMNIELINRQYNTEITIPRYVVIHILEPLDMEKVNSISIDKIKSDIIKEKKKGLSFDELLIREVMRSPCIDFFLGITLLKTRRGPNREKCLSYSFVFKTKFHNRF